MTTSKPVMTVLKELMENDCYGLEVAFAYNAHNDIELDARFLDDHGDPLEGAAMDKVGEMVGQHLNADKIVALTIPQHPDERFYITPDQLSTGQLYTAYEDAASAGKHKIAALYLDAWTQRKNEHDEHAEIQF